LFPHVPRRIGDRDARDYTALRDGVPACPEGGAQVDAAVDVSGYVPRHVRQACDVIGDQVGDQVGRYLFIRRRTGCSPER
jgi:2'-hydroxyisoflavone reductase